ncbi:LysM peptidoglycan-binding domain-containing protein [Pediococcus ethanolidurans]|uniref:Aggregation promoting factor surface protein n=2 Tax=Pediococcus ethanolidurans TaxID=319653 RepID=A0A0R2K0P3_9LACO|nr:LysM domain-containing protein [Pediococcus ethanolidurans]KRN83118.1 aggregation promoting factor surface protein [Pediococcus ethanolidurans]GEN95103.1 peptidase M23 [Pediococcus ethanolidurans]SER36822.1 LysM domain-containing protein [Pediococcus ethanolidurans]
MKLNKFTKFSVAFLSTITLGTIAWTTAASADETYTVKSGDTLSSIEYNFKHDTNYQQLAKANNIANANVIYVGQQLVIDTDSTTSQTTSTQQSQATQSTNTANTASSTQSKQNTQSTQNSSAYSKQSTQSTTKSQSTNTNTTSSTSTTSGSDASAKAWIANKESSGSYTARNGQYIGKYQLSSSYLNGDYSAANQEKVANSYVSSRYGSWTAAKAFWQANGWY